MRRNTKERKIRSLVDWDRPKLNGKRERFMQDEVYREKICHKARIMNVINIIVGLLTLLCPDYGILLLIITAGITFNLYYISDGFKKHEKLINRTTIAARVFCCLFRWLLVLIPVIGVGMFLVMSVLAEIFSALAAFIVLYFIPATICPQDVRFSN